MNCDSINILVSCYNKLGWNTTNDFQSCKFAERTRIIVIYTCDMAEHPSLTVKRGKETVHIK